MKHMRNGQEVSAVSSVYAGNVSYDDTSTGLGATVQQAIDALSSKIDTEMIYDPSTRTINIISSTATYSQATRTISL